MNYVPRRPSGNMILWGVWGGLSGVSLVTLGTSGGFLEGSWGAHGASWEPLDGLWEPPGAL